MYIVEQWIVSRNHPSYCIATYTGNPKHTIYVNIARISRDKKHWSLGLQAYFDAMDQGHTKTRSTEFGSIFVTNLSSFPSTLTVIPVPDGDIAAHRMEFIVNENLKQLKCMGRAAISLQPASDASKAKFLQTYRTSDKLNFQRVVQELVRLVQISLATFGCLNFAYIDGLFCEKTEQAIGDWWHDFGDIIKREAPNEESVLGPMTVATILGVYMGARNRLASLGENVPKDAFDIDQLKPAIGHFQKTHKVNVPQGTKRRLLDPVTLAKLYALSAKTVKKQNASNIGPFAFPRAFKSTVADLSGKPREGGITAIETTDLDTFIHNVYGDYPKFVWYGKRAKGILEPDFQPLLQQAHNLKNPKNANLEAGTDNSHHLDGRSGASHLPNQAIPAVMIQPPSNPDPLRIAVVKNMAGRNVEASPRDQEQAHHGLRDKIKDAVSSSRRHRHKNSMNFLKDDGRSPEAGEGSQKRDSLEVDLLRKSSFPERNSSPNNSSNKLQDHQDSPRNSQNTLPNAQPARPQTPKSPAEAENHRLITSTDNLVPGAFLTQSQYQRKEQRENARATSIETRIQEARPNPLIRAQSASRLHTLARNEEYYPRRMSYSLAEEALSTAPEPLSSAASPDTGAPNDSPVAHENTSALSDNTTFGDRKLQWEQSKEDYKAVYRWAAGEVKKYRAVEGPVGKASRQLKKLLEEHERNFQVVNNVVQDAIGKGIAPLQANIKELETMTARVHYELTGLRSKMKDVDDAVDNFALGVSRIEERAARGGLDIKHSEGNDGAKAANTARPRIDERQSWLGWGLSFINPPSLARSNTGKRDGVPESSGDQNSDTNKKPGPTPSQGGHLEAHKGSDVSNSSGDSCCSRGSSCVSETHCELDHSTTHPAVTERREETSNPRQARPQTPRFERKSNEVRDAEVTRSTSRPRVADPREETRGRLNDVRRR